MARVGVKSSIGGLYFDAILKTSHTSKLTITEHPVEYGANIADHAYLEAAEVSIEVGMSDVAWQASGSSRGSGSRSVSAFKSLQELQQKRQLLTVVTRLKTYKNMLIESITSDDDYTTMHAMRATVLLREVPVAHTKTVKVSARNAQTNTGTKQPVNAAANQSVLKEAASRLGLGG